MFDAMRKLYHAGVDCGMESFQGSGFVAWIVDAQNHRLEKHFAIEELEKIPGWLFAEAIHLRYPSADDIKRTPRDPLAELAISHRKDPRRITPQEREEHRQRGSSDQRSA